MESQLYKLNVLFKDDKGNTLLVAPTIGGTSETMQIGILKTEYFGFTLRTVSQEMLAARAATRPAYHVCQHIFEERLQQTRADDEAPTQISVCKLCGSHK